MSEWIPLLIRLALVYLGFGAGLSLSFRKGINLWHQLKEPPKYSLPVYWLQAIVVWPLTDWKNIRYYQRWAENIERDKDDRGTDR